MVGVLLLPSGAHVARRIPKNSEMNQRISRDFKRSEDAKPEDS